MDNFIYVISETLEYNKLICDDAGPGYARSMKWKSTSLKNLKNLSATINYVIDNRISQQETLQLNQIFIDNPSVTFIIKIVDPFLENLSHFYYIWACKMLSLKNIRLLSVYESKELTLFISQISSKPIIYAPYPYDQTKEVNLVNLAGRLNKIIISGSINERVYPFRSNIWLKSRRSFSRFLYDVLEHPGYPEIHNQDFTHQFTKDNFIKYLSKYKYMLLCGSRCGIEFLKFHECAYAGCLPIGNYPSIFPKEIQDIFYTPATKSLFFSTFKYLLKWNKVNHEEKILIYRNYLKIHRSVSKINENILSNL